MITKRSTRPLGPWAGRDARVDRAAKGGEGPARGGNRRPPRKWVSFFTRPPPPCLLQRFQRCHLKRLPPPRLTAAVAPSLAICSAWMADHPTRGRRRGSLAGSPVLPN